MSPIDPGPGADPVTDPSSLTILCCTVLLILGGLMLLFADDNTRQIAGATMTCVAAIVSLRVGCGSS